MTPFENKVKSSPNLQWFVANGFVPVEQNVPTMKKGELEIPFQMIEDLADISKFEAFNWAAENGFKFCLNNQTKKLVLFDGVNAIDFHEFVKTELEDLKAQFETSTKPVLH